MNCLKQIVVMLFALLIGSGIASGRNLDLSTVPERERVQLTIYNSEDLTLVRESRVVSFKRGVNPLQFSWANTLIDPTSVELEFMGKAGLVLMDTTFPHDKPQMLYWNVQSDTNTEARIEISYFTSGISWAGDYVAISNPAENSLRMEGFVRISNRSGEPYDNAQVRLVVGKINLVEKIAELARMPVERVREMEKREYKQLRQRAARKMMAPATMDAVAGMVLEESVAPKQVEKEGLGEYFIYTIEGRESIPDGWSKRLRSFDAAKVPVEVVYRYRKSEYGDRLVRLYLLRNNEKSGLGTTPIPNGEVQLFRQNGRKGLSYLATRSIKYVPIGDRMELNLGVDPDVVFELIKEKVSRDNIWVRLNKGRVYRKVGDGTFVVDHKGTVAGWDEHQLFNQRIRNYTDRKIRVEIRRSYSGDVTFRSRLDAKSHDYRSVEYSADVPAGARVDLKHEVITRNGYNAKQQRVEVVGG